MPPKRPNSAQTPKTKNQNTRREPDHVVVFTYNRKQDAITVSPQSLTNVDRGDVIRWVAEGHDVRVTIEPEKYFGEANSYFTLETNDMLDLPVIGGPNPHNNKNRAGFHYQGVKVGDDKPRDTGGENAGQGLP